MGALQKVSKFLGISKFGEGLASAGRVLTGKVGDDRASQQAADAAVQKLLYAAQQETDPEKKRRLIEFANAPGISSGTVQEGSIDKGLNLTNKEILGSAGNVVANIAMPGAFKGGTAAVIGKNALLGAGFGLLSGMEKNRSTSGIVGSTVGGAVVGGAVGTVGVLAKAAKEFIGQAVPEWIMNKAVKPALDDLRKNVKFGSATLGKELLDEGVKGGPKKLLQIAGDRLRTFEDELQKTLQQHDDKVIDRNKLWSYVEGLVKQKGKVPGAGGDIQRIKAIFNDLPEQMTPSQANEIKRAIYEEVRDAAYKLDAKLNAKGKTLKAIAKGLKTEIENTVGGTTVSEINKKLSIYGRLENSMVDQLAREMRNNGIGLTDAILAAGGPQTSWLALLRHAGKGTQTYFAQALKQVDKVGTGITARTTKNLGKRAVLTAP